MSVKTNLIIAAAAVLGVSSAYAGGPEMMAAPAAPSFTPYFYGELGLGYAQTAYQDFYNGVFNVDGADNSNGGLSYAGDFGYEFMPHLAVELGGGYLPEYKTNGTDNGKLSSWYAYGAGRLDTNINDKINVFGKVGVAYRSATFSADGVSDQDASQWSPFFGAGASYAVRDNIYVALEYNHIAGATGVTDVTGDGVDDPTPDANIYLAKVGYKFNF